MPIELGRNGHTGPIPVLRILLVRQGWRCVASENRCGPEYTVFTQSLPSMNCDASSEQCGSKNHRCIYHSLCGTSRSKWRAAYLQIEQYITIWYDPLVHGCLTDLGALCFQNQSLLPLVFFVIFALSNDFLSSATCNLHLATSKNEELRLPLSGPCQKSLLPVHVCTNYPTPIGSLADCLLRIQCPSSPSCKASGVR